MNFELSSNVKRSQTDLLFNILLTECGPGYYLNSGTCEQCRVGHISKQSHNEECEICPSGTYQSNDFTACLNCRAGYYQSSPGQKRCFSCRPGTFQNETGETFCYKCEGDWYSDVNGGRFCKICKSGAYFDWFIFHKEIVLFIRSTKVLFTLYCTEITNNCYTINSF